jgi:hypothetical protein
MTMFGGVLLYLSLFGLAVSFFSLLKPLRFLGIRTRKKGLRALGFSLLLFAAGIYLPVSETHVGAVRSHLDEFAPDYQFSEFHCIPIHVSKDRVDAAIRTVTPPEIRFYRTLTWMRRFGRPSPPGVLNPAPDSPILTTLTNGVLLADDPGEDIVFGGGGVPWGKKLRPEEFKSPVPAGSIKITVNFRIQELDAAHCRLTTDALGRETGCRPCEACANRKRRPRMGRAPQSPATQARDPARW